MANALDNKLDILTINAKQWSTSNVRLAYDESADMLFVRLGEPTLVDNLPIEDRDDILAMVRPGTNQIIGFQIENYKHGWLKRNSDVAAILSEDPALFQHYNSPATNFNIGFRPSAVRSSVNREIQAIINGILRQIGIKEVSYPFLQNIEIPVLDINVFDESGYP